MCPQSFRTTFVTAMPFACGRRVVLIVGRELGLELEETDVALEPVLSVSTTLKSTLERRWAGCRSVDDGSSSYRISLLYALFSILCCFRIIQIESLIHFVVHTELFSKHGNSNTKLTPSLEAPGETPRGEDWRSSMCQLFGACIARPGVPRERRHNQSMWRSSSEELRCT